MTDPASGQKIDVKVEIVIWIMQTVVSGRIYNPSKKEARVWGGLEDRSPAGVL